MRELFLWNSRSRVTHGEPYEIAQSVGANGDTAAPGRELNGVAHEVAKNLLQSSGIGEYSRRIGGDVHLEAKRLACSKGLERLDGFADERNDRHHLSLDGDVSRVDAR